MKILAIASEGGHWVQLLRLTPAFKDQELSFMSTNPDISATIKDYTYYRVPDANQQTKFKLIQCFFHVAWVVFKQQPKAIITTGAAPGLMGIIAGRLIGAKTIWIDSIANAEQLSLSGKIARYIADRVYTQWANLATNKIYYEGNVLS